MNQMCDKHRARIDHTTLSRLGELKIAKLTKRGCRGGRKGRRIEVITNNSVCANPSHFLSAEVSVPCPRQRCLVEIPLVTGCTGRTDLAPKVRFALWNARSMKRQVNETPGQVSVLLRFNHPSQADYFYIKPSLKVG